ncbi:MAG: efflux RND transporter permease subunit [Candidatus Aminicenantes bacterium]|nr:efflux RND transporter permease subunit [Candidatus Aminicenantes bacterium]
MNIARLAIDNFRFTLILLALLVISGTVSFFTMPRSEDPQVAPAGASVIALYPGAGPADLEELVADPIEEKLNELDDIKRIDSKCGDSISVTSVQFESGTDMDDVFAKITQKVNSIRGKLPAELRDLTMTRWLMSDFVIILQVALVSETAPFHQLDAEAERLKKMVEKVPGVKRVRTWAVPQREVRISLDLGELAERRIPLSQVIAAVQSANSNVPAGHVDLGGNRFILRSSGSFQDLGEIADTIIHAHGEKVVFLKDIAEVGFAHEDQRHVARANGKRCVFVTVNQKEDTNILEVRKGIGGAIGRFGEKLPASISLATVFDQSESVRRRLNFFFGNFLQGLLLVGLVVLFAMGLRVALIVLLIIPVSILIALGFVDLSGYGLQQMSITGFVIALGILVDNAIVVTDNIARFLRQGGDPQRAAIDGSRQISWAIVSSTLTTVFAFLPIAMMGFETGDYIRSMPVTVIYSLLASLLVALTLTPFLSSRFLRLEKEQRETMFRRLVRLLTEKYYRPLLAAALSRPWRTVILAASSFLFSLVLFQFVGISFFPKAEKPQLVINIETPDGANLQYTDQVARRVERILRQRVRMRRYAVNVGRGNPQIHYSIDSKEYTPTHAQLIVEIPAYDPQEVAAMIESLRGEFARCPGARIEVKEIEQGPNSEAPIAIKVLGDDLETLRSISLAVEGMFLSTPGTVNVQNPLGSAKTDLRIQVNKAAAGMLGVPMAMIDQTIRAAISGVPVTTVRDRQGKEYDVVARLPLSGRPGMEDLERIYVTSTAGAAIPLGQVARLEFESSPKEISHYNFSRAVTITADVRSGFSTDRVTRGIIAKMDRWAWPRGYEYYVAGEMESRQESFGGMGRAVIIALLAIFAVLVLEFRSFSQPLIVFTTIPLAVIGSILMLFIAGISFSFTAFIGLTSLFGIVVNNAILLVEYTNQLRTGGRDIVSALKEAGETRLTPILLTTATTIGGLLPLALRGGTMYAPMALTLIGGLLVSTLLTLVVTPVFYLLMTRNGR